MRVTVEFLGLARRRAGRPAIALQFEGPQTSLGTILDELTQQLPNLGQELRAGRDLSPHWTICVEGQRFIRDPDTAIQDGQCLWVVSADAGG